LCGPSLRVPWSAKRPSWLDRPAIAYGWLPLFGPFTRALDSAVTSPSLTTRSPSPTTPAHLGLNATAIFITPASAPPALTLVAATTFSITDILHHPRLPPPSPNRYIPPMAKLSPIVSEFASTEEEEAYDAWFRAKVEARLASKAPGIPHDEVMAEMQAILDRHAQG